MLFPLQEGPVRIDMKKTGAGAAGICPGSCLHFSRSSQQETLKDKERGRQQGPYPCRTGYARDHIEHDPSVFITVSPRVEMSILAQLNTLARGVWTKSLSCSCRDVTAHLTKKERFLDLLGYGWCFVIVASCNPCFV